MIFDLWPGEWAQHTENLNAHRSSPTQDNASSALYLEWFIILTVATTVLGVFRAIYFVWVCVRSSRYMQQDLLGAVLAAPINTYFDVTPVGRILNRFSKDLDNMDCLLPDFFLNNLTNGFVCLFIVIVCLASSPYFVVLFIPLGALFFYVQNYFRKSSRELKRYVLACVRGCVYVCVGGRVGWSGCVRVCMCACVCVCGGGHPVTCDVDALEIVCVFCL